MEDETFSADLSKSARSHVSIDIGNHNIILSQREASKRDLTSTPMILSCHKPFDINTITTIDPNDRQMNTQDLRAALKNVIPEVHQFNNTGANCIASDIAS